MKYVLLATVLVLALSTSSEESVLQLLGELKHNAELELEGLELAWQRRIAEKQGVADSLNQSVINQRAECQNKQDDITQKQNDILASESFINWMLGRQKSNTKRIGVLEANICALTNNYVNDIRNYRYALAVVKFLREELTQLESGASLAQITQFHERITKFVKLYKTGSLVNLMEKIDDQSDVLVPEIEQGFDEVSLIQRLRPKALSQLDQQEDDDKADNAVVLIPGCDDSINTVVVVQNDDGSSNSGDVNVKITNGGATTKPVGGKSSSGSSGSTKKPQPATDPAPHHHTDTQPEAEDGSDDTEEATGDDDAEETDGAEEQGNGEDSGEDSGEDGETDGEGESSNGDDVNNGEDGEGEESAEDDGEEHEQIPIDDYHQPHEQPQVEEIKPATIGPHINGEEDFTDDWEGFKKLLDAIENHTRKSLEQSANDEVRSSLGFVDFKLHVELENQHFDKTIQYEQDYLVKQVNQLTGRRQAAILCGARLKQLTVASQVAQKDIDAAKQFYQEQKQLKQEEVNTFDDVFHIYTTKVKN